MASNNNTQPRTSGDSLEKQVGKIMGSLSVLNKLLTEDPLARSKKEEEITVSNKYQKGASKRSQSEPPALAPLVSLDDRLITRLQYNLRQLKVKLAKLEQLQTNVEEELTKHLDTLQSLIGKFDSSRRGSSKVTHWIKADLQGMETKISELLSQVPFLSIKLEEQKAEVYAEENDDQRTCLVYFPGIHANVEYLTKREVFRQVKHKFKELDTVKKICLLSFAVFPENQEVHRTMLMYWWIGEGILPVKEAEVTVRQVLKAFTEKNLVEPVEERWRVAAPSSYKMSPFVHSSVVILSKEIGLFDIYRQGKKPMMNISEMGKVCLVEGSSSQLEATTPKKMPSRDHIETVFNVSERLPDFTFSWFSEYPSNKRKLIMSKLSANWYKSLKVFYLGRWERSKKRNIQVQSPNLMQCLNHLRNLRLLSFQGISGIRSLNSSVCKLHKLIILDLRECYDLKYLPEKIYLLGRLVYLDMTGCYMLEWIPLGLALLENLEVLKGFVVSDLVYEGVACKLSYLKKLKKLRKLSIEINRDDLGVEQVMEDLLKLKALISLKVTWRRDLRIIHSTEIQSLSDQLKKLNLQRYPHEELPTWLHPRNLLHLKKLQLGGGRRLKGFGDLPDKATECNVEVLRLTSLPKLRVGWMELKQLYFPNLIYLESYECPRVTLTPCDGSGVWRSDQDD